MASAPQEKDLLENPFQQQTDETDVIIEVGDETLHLHSGVLSIYSPVLRGIFLTQRRNADGNISITLEGKILEHVVKFFMLFYPEYKQKFTHGQMMITEDYNAIQSILLLSEEYQVDWIPKWIDGLVCAPEYLKIISNDLKINSNDLHVPTISRNFASTLNHKHSPERQKKEKELLFLCDRFKLVNLTKTLITNACFTHLHTFMDSDKLNPDTKLTIAMAKISTMTKNENKETQRRLNAMLPHRTPAKEVAKLAEKIVNKEKEETAVENIIKEISGGAAYEVFKIHPFGVSKEDSDFIVKVEDRTLHLHSAILSHCSPVFEAMLSGNSQKATAREIILKDKKAEHVILLFGFCYSDNLQKLTESTNYEELLALCQTYQLNWLIEIIEKYLVETERFSNDNNNHKQIVTGLKLADRFNLNELRNDVLRVVTSVNELCKTDGFSELAKSTKYQLARKSICVNMRLQGGNLMLKILDNYFKDI